MQVQKLKAEQVHGYLPIEVDFFSDLTFLTGLNGSGKTSALRLLMGLLTPQIEELASIAFSSATATILENGNERTITALRSDGGLLLSVSGLEKGLELKAAELQILLDHRRRTEETRPPLYTFITSHPVFETILKISTPMFLGLDRRFFYPDSPWREISNEWRRRELMQRRLTWTEDNEPIRGTVAGGLADVNILVQETMNQIRASQEVLDNELRKQILLGAFEFKPSDVTRFTDRPSRASIEKYRQRKDKFERAATGLRLPVADVQAALNKFFEKMNEIADSIEQSKQGSKSKKTQHKAFFDWLVNQPQAERIFDHLALLDTYAKDREQLHEPIERFLTLVNKFLTQTKKKVQLTERGSLEVINDLDSHRQSLAALSSGERQIVVMLAHLALNKQLTGSGVFIVDEPELSLHIGWQEIFVQSIRIANPTVQLIMATHSPAIILDDEAHCRSLSI